ncbi:hypothetical protein EUX47_06495 [Haemophilus haemolyticus]|nr:hypothetical protein DPV82_05915 [Haemophilus haemolyticus]TPH04550.1 hypothetical protein EUX47_06495 [Haemophilus haemolyticus]TPH25207.1 hypothetical protein EUX46_06940 [Haemophilus haemolyticus]
MPISILKFDILNKLEELIIGKILYIEFAKKETESLILDSYKFKKSLHPDAKRELITINGFMNIYSNVGFSPFNMESFKEKGILLNDLNYLISPSSDKKYRYVIYLSVLSDEPIYLSINNIYILDNDLNEFIEGRIIGSVSKLIEEQINISPRKEANKTEFIRALLKTHYGTDDPNECRKLLYNGKLAKDFARAKIEPDIITPETLRNWLNTEK